MQEAAKTGNSLQGLGRILKTANRVLIWIAIVALLVMMVITVYNITGRALFNSPVVAAIEIAELCSVVFVALGLACTEANHSNIIVPVVIDKLPFKVKRVLYYVALFLSLAIVGILIWTGFTFGIETILTEETTDIMRIPTGFFRMLWVAGCVFLFVALISHVVKGFKKE